MHCMHTKAHRSKEKKSPAATFERIMVDIDGPKPASKKFNTVYFMWQWMKLTIGLQNGHNAAKWRPLAS